MSDFDAAYRDLESRLLDWIVDPVLDPSPAGQFDRFALEVYRFQYCYNPAYRRYCEQVLGGDASSIITDPRDIPAVPTDSFKLTVGHPSGITEAAAERVFLTSGTTVGRRGRHPVYDTRLYRASIRAGWRLYGFAGHDVIGLVPSPADAPASSLSFMVGELTSRFLVSASGQIDIDQLERLLAGSPPDRPLLLFGTALAFLHLIEDQGLRVELPPGSAVVETGGYKGSGRSIAKAELYRLIADSLGVRPESIANEYSMTELSSQFWAHGAEAVHRSPHWARVTVTDPETGAEVADGATGYVRVLDLANLGSVAATTTNDLAVRRGSDFELVGRDPAALSRGCSIGADELLTHPPA